ncbi:MAG: hypothetical protein ABFS41_02070 [Myxococcota bacterium]
MGRRGPVDWRNWAVLLVSGVLVVAVLGVAELWLRTSDRGPAAVERAGRYTRPSEAMGWGPVPGITARSRKVRGEDVLYDVAYAFDPAGRRIVPDEPGQAYAKFLLFFGGSNTFGEGLEAEDSLPRQTARHLAGVRAYNYAYRGYGPQHLLARLESTDLRAEVEEPEGVAVYVLPGFHLHRLFGSSRTMSWVDRLPYYREEEGRLVRDGFYQTTRPMYAWSMKSIGRSRLLRRLGIAWPLRFTDTHRALACRLFAQARDDLDRQLPSVDLVVALHPSGQDQDWSCLEPAGIATIDLRSAWAGVPVDELTIPGDGHVNARGNELLGRELARALEPLLVARQ